MHSLANVLALEGKLGEASTFYAKSIALDQALAPAAALGEAVSLGNLARIRFEQGSYADAEAGFHDAIERKQHLLGADYGDNGRSHDRTCLAEVLIARGRFDQARELADQALAEARERHRDAHPDIAFALTTNARVMAALGQRERAVAYAGDAVAMYVAMADMGSDKSIRARLVFGEILQGLDRKREAKAQFEGALAAARAIEPNVAALIVHAAADLERVDDALGAKAAARGLRVEAVAALAAIPTEPNTERDVAMRLVADASTQSRR